MYIMHCFDQQLPLFQALSSDLRVQIMKLILANEGITLKQLSADLKIPVSTLCPHIARLKDCGLIRVEEIPAAHGIKKCCYSAVERILIDFALYNRCGLTIQEEIPIGYYTGYQLTPACGLASAKAFIGKTDSPSAFSHLERVHAGILWFHTGYLEYLLPNTLPDNSTVEQLSFSFELSSGVFSLNNSRPSDIEFYLNGIRLGLWTCSGNFNNRRGELNPSWWYNALNQYGQLKKLTLDSEGTWLDHDWLSSVTIKDLHITPQSTIKLRFQVSANSVNPGGMTIYGRGFGNHNQHIRMSVKASAQES